MTDPLHHVPMELLTIRQTAELFGVARTTIYRWERAGVLVPVRVGGIVRYRRADIETLLRRPDIETPDGDAA